MTADREWVPPALGADPYSGQNCLCDEPGRGDIGADLFGRTKRGRKLVRVYVLSVTRTSVQ